MGLEHLAAVWEHSRQSGSHLIVLVAVASYSDHNGEWTIDQATLQRRARLGNRRVRQILMELVTAGELAITSHHGRGKLSTYRLLIGKKNWQPAASFPDQKEEARCQFSEEKLEARCQFSGEKPEADCQFSQPPIPPFPPNPHIPPTPTEATAKTKTKNQETCGLRPLSGPQAAVSRVNFLLAEAGVPLPSPAQISLWSKTLGGIEPLLALLTRLIQAGLANKREPAAYIHRLVMEQAVRPEPARPMDARAGRELLRAAGADETRWQQALEIINTTEES